MTEEKDWENRPPAKLTLEKLEAQDKLNKNLIEKDNLFDKNIALMQKDIKDINDKLDGMTGKLDKFIESVDGKYASKFTEILLFRVLFGVGIFALLTVIYFIFEKVGLPR